MRNAPALVSLLVMTTGLPGVASGQAPGPTGHLAPVIYRIEPVSPRAGDKITIVGRGFSALNTVAFGRLSIRDVSVAWAAGITCVPGDSACHPGINQGLTLTVPVDAVAGRYDVSVENGNGVSNIVSVTVIASPLRAR